VLVSRCLRDPSTLRRDVKSRLRAAIARTRWRPIRSPLDSGLSNRLTRVLFPPRIKSKRAYERPFLL